MIRSIFAAVALSLAMATAPAVAQDKPAAPAAKPPLFATTKVEGTDNVCVFRYGNHLNGVRLDWS